MLPYKQIMQHKKSKDTKTQDENFTFDYSSCTTYLSNSTDYGSIFHYNNNINHSATLNAQESAKSEPYYSRIIRQIIAILCAAVIITTLPISIWFCLKKVPSLERLVVFRLGVLQKVKGPGYVIILPYLDHYIRVDLKPKSFQVPKSQVLTRDGGIVEVETTIHYQLVDVIQSVLQVNKINDVVKSLAKQSVSSAITSNDQDYLEKQNGLVENDIKELINKSTLSWGLEVTGVDMGPIKVLKAAEPKTAISALVSTLRSAIGCPEETETNSHSAISFLQGNVNATSPVSVFEKLKQKVEYASSQGCFLNLSGVIKLDIEDLSEKYIAISHGKGWMEEFCGSQDVTVHLSLSSLGLLLDGVKTPYQAYADGSIRVEGDYNLLIEFVKHINQTQV